GHLFYRVTNEHEVLFLFGSSLGARQYLELADDPFDANAALAIPCDKLLVMWKGPNQCGCRAGASSVRHTLRLERVARHWSNIVEAQRVQVALAECRTGCEQEH